MRMGAPRATWRIAVDLHWIYGRSVHDDDASTCDDGSEHDTTSSSDDSEWEQDFTLSEAFECHNQGEHQHLQYDREWEPAIATHGDATSVTNSDRTRTHSEERTRQ